MKSLTTIINETDFSKLNNGQFGELLRKLDPELYLIHIALKESNVNPLILPHIIRTIGNLAIGTGYGKVQIFMQARVITNIKPEESVSINEIAIIE
jgi:hypothetical protein